MGYNAVVDNTGLSSFVQQLLPLKSTKSQLVAIQGHPMSSIFVPIESAYATSY